MKRKIGIEIIYYGQYHFKKHTYLERYSISKVLEISLNGNKYLLLSKHTKSCIVYVQTFQIFPNEKYTTNLDLDGKI